MSSSPRSAGGASSWAANLALGVVSLLVTAIAVEIGVRWLVDFDLRKPLGVYDIDYAAGGLSFVRMWPLGCRGL